MEKAVPTPDFKAPPGHDATDAAALDVFVEWTGVWTSMARRVRPDMGIRSRPDPR